VSGEVVLEMQAHDGRKVCCLDVCNDGTRMASGGEDGTVRVWEVSTGKRLQVLQGHRYEMNNLVCVCVCLGGRFWILPSVACLAARFFLPPPSQRGRGVDDLTNVFPDTSRKRQRRRRPLHNVVNVVTNLNPKYSSQVNGVSFSADGSLVASCSGNTGFGGSGDCSVRMWSVETGQELKKFLGHRCVVSGCCSPFSASQRRSCCSRASCR
jgi:WD40 repeat protein